MLHKKSGTATCKDLPTCMAVRQTEEVEVDKKQSSYSASKNYGKPTVL